MKYLNIIPNRYVDYSSVKKISELTENEIATIHAKIISIKNIHTKTGKTLQIGSVEDESGKITVVWFNQPYLVKSLFPGKLVSLAGKVKLFSNKLSLSSPEYELLHDDKDTVHTGKLIPVYPETKYETTKFIRRKIRNEFSKTDFTDYFSNKILDKYKIVDLKTAYEFVHFPKSLEDVGLGKKRLAFNELLFLQLQALTKKLKFQKNKSPKLSIDDTSMNRFIAKLPFELTDSQKKAKNEILKDLGKSYPMNRLLEGDVGSGKTVVATIAILASYLNGYHSVFMAPTQILANQHFQTLSKLLPKLKISLVVSKGQQLVTNDSDIYIGTHALLHKKIDFPKVALVIIDEQHRFGVDQRRILANLPTHPHVLTMTATPIPRTVAQVAYGDMNVSRLTDMPKGRQKVTTWIVPETKRKGAYDWIKSQIANHESQIFWICPLIEESMHETMKDVKNVTQEFKNLKLKIKNSRIALLHGRMKSIDKEKILSDFRNHKTDILVSTSVIEVGIDIPNATVIVIEATERFGLAQLHQLRGRVGRGLQKSYCLLFSNIKYSKRLKAMTKTHSGFELAELDLKLRGPGEIFGTAQSGFPELKVASWNNKTLVKNTKELAIEIIKNPKKFKEFKMTASLRSQ